MSNEATIFYDLPSRDGHTWSPNTWKTRMLLNFKNIPYQTQWVEYPDIEPLLRSLSIPPADDSPPYTLPAIRFDGVHTMDSYAIAPILERAVPSPPAHIDDPIVARVRANMPGWFGPLRNILIPQVPTRLLNPRSQEYFQRTRTQLWGRDLREFEREYGQPGEKAEECWAKAREPLEELAGILREKGGPFFLGSEAGWVDIIVVSVLEFVRRVSQADFNRLVRQVKELGRLYEASKRWLERDD